LYGVDKNPFAVNLARLSMWLVTLAFVVGRAVRDADLTY
jgi:type II restriction/modification system DNA methylase subunit YeeA